MKLEAFEAYVRERPYRTTGLLYATIGLVGESGEALEEMKKSWRETGVPELTEDRRTRYLLELGDTLFYLTRSAMAAGSSLEQVADLLMQKHQQHGWADEKEES